MEQRSEFVKEMVGERESRLKENPDFTKYVVEDEKGIGVDWGELVALAGP